MGGPNGISKGTNPPIAPLDPGLRASESHTTPPDIGSNAISSNADAIDCARPAYEEKGHTLPGSVSPNQSITHSSTTNKAQRFSRNLSDYLDSTAQSTTQTNKQTNKQ